ncbi:MAG TPA: endolytic transglycosylase MltG [Gemmatimonadaceae bacterium]|nr:endolytic transglycosylase MltG [Gemmatimonadaceae bacterium]
MARIAGFLLALSLAACGGESSKGVARTTIPPRTSLRVAAESLSRAGLIGSPTMFRLYAKIRGGERSVRAGTYELRKDLGYAGILEAITGGKGLVRTVTIPEGFSVMQVVRTVATKLSVPPESVEAAVRDTAWRRRLDVPAATLDGYLFPDTYTVPEGATARDLVALMVRRFEQVWKPEWTARLDTIGMTRNDVLTLASIVEKEAKLPQERPVIAGVYMNRLRIGMLLQADPTVQYALPSHQTRLLYRHLRVQSDYNTYMNKGLPPGPIASPGRPSIEAALYPAQVPYRYFVAFPDGHHEFRATAAQHEAVVREARKAWAAYYRLHPPDTAAARAATPPAAPAPARRK